MQTSALPDTLIEGLCKRQAQQWFGHNLFLNWTIDFSFLFFLPSHEVKEHVNMSDMKQNWRTPAHSNNTLHPNQDHTNQEPYQDLSDHWNRLSRPSFESQSWWCNFAFLPNRQITNAGTYHTRVTSSTKLCHESSTAVRPIPKCQMKWVEYS